MLYLSDGFKGNNFLAVMMAFESNNRIITKMTELYCLDENICMKQIGLIKALSLTKTADKMTDKERNALQRKRLKDLVSYVKSRSPYFASLYQGGDENAPLSSLPVTNKAEMMAHFDDWLTDRSITKDKVKRFMSDLSNVGKKLDGKYLVYTTSGSTGNPCIMLYYHLLSGYCAALPENRI